jgi:hypothetical protein
MVTSCTACFNIEELRILFTEFSYVFLILRINNDYVPKQH